MRKLDNVNVQYHNLLEEIRHHGFKKGDRTGTGTFSIYGHQLKIDMTQGFPLLTTKKLHTKSIIGELLWFLSGSTSAKELRDRYGVTIWDEWQKDQNGSLGPVYGKQWVSWESYKYVNSPDEENPHSNRSSFEKVSINQIQRMIDRLKSNPDCRRNIVSAWNVSDLEDMVLMPCHYGFQVYTRELSLEERVNIFNQKKESGEIVVPEFKSVGDTNAWTNKLLDTIIPTRAISLMWNQRSVDTFLGLPFNIASYGFLLHMIAQQVNMVPEQLIGCLGDTHLYSNHVEYAKEFLQRDPNRYPLPKLELNKANSIFDYKPEDFKIVEYDAYPNWKNVPIAV